MKIENAVKLQKTSLKKRDACKSSHEEGGFGASVSSAGTAATSPASVVFPLSAADTVIALQGIDPQGSPRAMIAKGRQILDVLSEVQTDILKGALNEHKLKDLSRVVQEKKAEAQDPALQDILNQIHQRAEIELAKLGYF